ncbi:NAD(P)H-dependent oxidoreductase [Glycomyces sp. TRM65418]|uniref:NAD(P)H-dependent oxidoreductase n=1 Tax=Glycomyces sp. TRM65418 TaxID=2867006 RepID=UPI001CE4BB46|nr:NAD(P)H-dependent oxidoreductase [Glycomyces sp. TRM65418]MCC3765226.1 NAD(P)H-dependent oxidoreductase [Glycomyces sp. TRM65418]QZD54850.1 NAD(P)H-dependent oxidoreductase [Glycomyces sp. TRM65418]
MRTHIVYAHPHARSLNAALRDETVQTLEGLGHTVTVADLYAMNWKAVADYDDFGPTENEHFMAAAGEAWDKGSLTEDVKAEQERLLAADAVILQFPLWWFTVPAIMKGWMDRVFTNGFGYGTSRSWPRYGDGVLAGKRAMVVVTTGAAEAHLSDRGVNGAIDDLLFPIQHGVLFYTGMQVLPPTVITSAVTFGESDYADAVKLLRGRLETLAETEPIAYRRQDDDYGADKRLLPGREAEGTTGFALHIA